MATFAVCPIDGCVPFDNGTNTTPVNNQVNSNSDAVVTASGVIGSATGTTVIVTTGANFPAGTTISIPTRNETMAVTSVATNTLTVTRASRWQNGIVVPQGTASAAIAVADPILVGTDVQSNPPHCPLCGSAMIVVDQAGKVNAQTGVAVGSQVPANVDLVYRTQADSALAQVGTVTNRTGTSPVVTAGFNKSPGNWSGVNAQDGEPTTWNTSANSVNAGARNVTPETLNATVGP